MKKIALLVGLFVFAINVIAQKNPSDEKTSRIDQRNFGLVYEIPEMKNIRIKPGVSYFKDEKKSLAVDLYLPSNTGLKDKRPAVIFLNAVGDEAKNKPKDWEIYRTWARLVAANGFVGVTMEAEAGRIQENLPALFEFIEKEGAQHGIDKTRLGIYAASANVTPSTRYLFSNEASKGIRAAVLYYGTVAPAERLRKDLPVLYVLVESDLKSGLGRESVGLWEKVADAGAPWTLIFASNQPHAFDAFSDTIESRRLIEQTISFWKANLEYSPQTRSPLSGERAIMAAIYGNDSARATDLLKPYLEKYPNDTLALGYYGSALQELKRYDEALAVFQKAINLKPNDPELYGAVGRLYFAKGQFAEAADNFSKAIAGGLNGPGIYRQLGNAQMALNRWEQAIGSYEKAIERGLAKRSAYYNIACAYVGLKQNDRAVAYLNKAIDEGFADRATLESDTDLAPLRIDDRFQQVLARLSRSNK